MIDLFEDVKSALNQISEDKIQYLKKLIMQTKGKIVILGNGGSNAISAHMAEDYTKALKKPSLAFTDGAMLTCYANDYGYDKAFAQYLSEFSDRESLVILISSSGNSQNILACAKYCSENNIDFVILTGFAESNKLKSLYNDIALLEFWVDSTKYGVIESVHELILHSVIE